MTTNNTDSLRIPRGKSTSPWLSYAERKQQILIVAAKQFAATGLASTTTFSLAEAAGVSEPMLYVHFESKKKLFEEAVAFNAQLRIAALRERFLTMPHLAPLEWVEKMAEWTVMAAAGDHGNASILAWALLETPEFAADAYRAELGATEALWVSAIATRFALSPLRNRLASEIAPHAVQACMAFGFWLATLRHQPGTVLIHARQYARGIGFFVRAALGVPSESPGGTKPGANTDVRNCLVDAALAGPPEPR